MVASRLFVLIGMESRWDFIPDVSSEGGLCDMRPLGEYLNPASILPILMPCGRGSQWEYQWVYWTIICISWLTSPLLIKTMPKRRWVDWIAGQVKSWDLELFMRFFNTPSILILDVTLMIWDCLAMIFKSGPKNFYLTNRRRSVK